MHVWLDDLYFQCCRRREMFSRWLFMITLLNTLNIEHKSQCGLVQLPRDKNFILLLSQWRILQICEKNDLISFIFFLILHSTYPHKLIVLLCFRTSERYCVIFGTTVAPHNCIMSHSLDPNCSLARGTQFMFYYLELIFLTHVLFSRK